MCKNCVPRGTRSLVHLDEFPLRVLSPYKRFLRNLVLFFTVLLLHTCPLSLTFSLFLPPIRTNISGFHRTALQHSFFFLLLAKESGMTSRPFSFPSKYIFSPLPSSSFFFLTNNVQITPSLLPLLFLSLLFFFFIFKSQKCRSAAN